MQFLKKLTLGIFALSMLTAIGCGGDDDNGGPAPSPSPREAILSGNIEGVRTLSKDTVYRVIGFVNVQPGAKLIIPAGTKLVGNRGDRACLQTLRGPVNAQLVRTGAPSGQIIAEGTATEPIVFTSGAPVGSRRRGDIGGIVLNGNARNNVPGGTRIGEGGAANGGGNIDDDSSGVLRYVRVEFGGVLISEGNEINGFTFNSVGRSTRLEYLQAHFIQDDAFEWFGGTANAKYLVATGCDDDQIDTEFGTRNKIQFAAIVEDANLANRGYEFNNDGSGTSVKPHNQPIIYNVTMVGAGKASANNENNDGLFLRANTGALLYNHIVANFGGMGLVINGTPTRDNLKIERGGDSDDSAIVVRNSIFWNKSYTQTNGNPNWAGVGSAIPNAADSSFLYSVLAAPGMGNLNQNPNFRSVDFNNPMNGTKPDLRPTTVVTGATPPNDGFFDPTATYIGAFGTTDWMEGWTTWAIN